MFKELYKYIDTKFALTIQDHAYVLHPKVWTDEFLEYDYIGAPWVYSNNAYITDEGKHVRVGNGGFSLRSKVIMKMPYILGLGLEERQGFYNEDGNICVYHRKTFLEHGVRYAPIEVASRFSYENLMSENFGVKPFGYHRNRPIKTWRD
jgi:hypothetical protein